MSAAATSSSVSIYESSNVLQQQQPYLTSPSSFGTLPDTITEFGNNNTSTLLDSIPNTTSNSNQALYQATTTAQMDGQPSGYNSTSAGTILTMGTSSGGSNYAMFSSAAADSSADTSTSSSRTRLPGLNSTLNNDSGLSTLSSNSANLMPSTTQLLTSTPIHLLQQQQQPLNMCYNIGADSPSKSGCIGMPGAPIGDDIDEFEAMPRDRCNTWPLRRPTLDINAQTSPLIHDRIPEEDNAYDENSDTIDESGENMAMGGDGGDNMIGMVGSPSGYSNEMSPMRSDSAIGESSRTDSPPSTKKSTTRRNAWGNMSYADLITQAILNSPEKRLTLSQVYEWMVQNVPYFRDKGDSNSSAGWKEPIVSSTLVFNPLMNSPPQFPMDTSEIGGVFAAEPRGRCYTWPAPPPTSMFNPAISSHSSSPSSSLNNSMCSSINGHQQQSAPYGTPASINTHVREFAPVMHSNFPSTSAAADIFSSHVPVGTNSNSMGHLKMPSGQALPSINFLRTPSTPYIQPQRSQYGESFTSTSPPSVFLSRPGTTTGEMESMSGDEDAESLEEQEGCDKLVDGDCTKKKRIRRRNPDTMSQKKPNPWGEESYSDLIARALSSAPEGRLKLNEIYQWFSENVPYFRDRSSQEDAQGWKNSIRHNLSLHSRFMRIQNEGAGKSSWWVINPDAKPGRNPRRRAATMETTNKGIIDKKRRGARKRVEMQLGRSAGTSVISSQASILSQDLYNDSDEMIGGPGGNFDSFRPRTQSTLSIPGNSSRVSPTLEPPGFEDFDFPPWMDAVAAGAPAENVTEILDRTDQMRLDGGLDSGGFAQPIGPTASRPLLNGVKLEPMTPLESQSRGMITQRSDILNVTIKQEIQPPPSYQELNVVRGNPSQMQNPLLRGQMTGSLSQQQKMPQGLNTYYTNRNGNVFVSQQQSTASPPPGQQYIMAGASQNMSMGSALPHWVTNQHALQQMGSINLQQGDYGTQTSSALPLDLENLAMPADGQMLDLDMETVLRHELSQTRDNQLHFDLP